MANIPKHRELTNYEQWQLEKYGNVLKDYSHGEDGTLQANEDELRRLEEWVYQQEELQREEVENV